MTQSRRLAVIMFTDVVGYTALMGEDERKALTILRQNKGLHRRLLRQFNGKFLKEMGDGILCSFKTITDAVYCAGQLRNQSKDIDGLQLRIGMHLGEIVVEGTEIYGDGINVASRIEGVAQPGQILVSEAIYKNIRNKSGITCSYEGDRALKNVSDPVKVYSVDVRDIPAVTPRRSYSRYIPWGIGAILVLGAILLLSVLQDSTPSRENLSIAVLPFDDMSLNGNQVHLGYGIADGLINSIGQQREVPVIAKTSSFRFGGKDMDLTEIGEELGVTHIVEGGVKTAGDQIRITVQLIDARSNYLLWASTFDRPLSDIFTVEDEITDSLFHTIGMTLASGRSQREVNPDAYKLYLEAKFILENNEYRYDIENLVQAQDRFQNAIGLDSNFALAYAGYAEVCLRTRTELGGPEGSQAFQQRDSVALQLISKAYTLDPHKGYINSVFGTYYLWHGDLVLAHKYYVKAIEIEPGNAIYLRDLATVQRVFGLFDEFDWLYRRALRLDPVNQAVKFELAVNYRISGLWGEADSLLKGILEHSPGHAGAFSQLFYISCLRRDLQSADSLLSLTRQAKSNVGGLDLDLDIYYAAKNEPDSVKDFRGDVYMLLGQTDQVIERYEKWYQERPLNCAARGLAFLNDESVEMDPEFRNLYRPLLEHPRFPALMEEMQRRYEENLKRFSVKGRIIPEN